MTTVIRSDHPQYPCQLEKQNARCYRLDWVLQTRGLELRLQQHIDAQTKPVARCLPYGVSGSVSSTGTGWVAMNPRWFELPLTSME